MNKKNLLKRVSGGDTVVNGNLNINGNFRAEDYTTTTNTNNLLTSDTVNNEKNIYIKKKCLFC